jgi:predicted Zn-dependent peptidase
VKPGLVYSLTSSLDTTSDSSLWWFGAQVLPKNSPALFEIIVREIKKIRQGEISTDELEATKQYLLGRHQRSAQTVGGTLAGYSGRYFFDGVIENYHGIPKRIKAITKDQIVEAAQEMFKDKIGGVSLLGNNQARQLHESLNDIVSELWT